MEAFVTAFYATFGVICGAAAAIAVICIVILLIAAAQDRFRMGRLKRAMRGVKRWDNIRPLRQGPDDAA